MKPKAQPPARGGTSKKVKGRVATLPLKDAVHEALAQLPEPFRAYGVKKGADMYLMLAAYEGLLAMAEYFQQIKAKRRIVRSDLVFRLEVVPGQIGRAAQAEEESRAIEAVLAAAEKSAKAM